MNGDVASLPSLGVVITSYNTTPLTLRCIEGLHRYSTRQPDEIVVVDDASTQPLRDALPPGIILVENQANQGYVRSVNLGVARLSTDVVLLLDSDAAPVSDVVAPTQAHFARKPQLGALGFRLVDQQGRTTGSEQPEPTALGLAVGQALEARFLATRPHPKGWFTIHSCAIAFRRQVFSDLGGFDERFDFLDADTDFSMRLWRAGWTLDRETNIRILHEGGGSPQTTARRVVRFHTNRWRLLEKHGLISHPSLLKGVLSFRHAAELAWLMGPAALLNRDGAKRRDKLDGRRRLISTVWNSYVQDRPTGPA